MNLYEKTEKAYNDLIKVVKKNESLLDYKVSDVEYKKDIELLKIEFKELGFTNYISFSGTDFAELFNQTFYYINVKEGNNKTISWSDDGRQPVNERLIKIRFPTGAYIFGSQYDTATFNEFFNELKSFNPLYLDSANKCLYFDLQTGAEVFKNYKEIFNKYLELSKERNKENKRQELLKQIEELDNA